MNDTEIVLIELLNDFGHLQKMIRDHYKDGFRLIGSVQVAITNDDTIYLATLIKENNS